MTGKQNTLLWLGIACLSVIWVGCCIRIDGSSQAKAKRQDQLSSSIGPHSTLAVKTDFGSITVTGTDANECRVTADVSVNAPTEQEAQELLAKVKVVLTPTADGLSLEVEKPTLWGNRSVGVSFTVTVPRDTSLDCRTSFGSIHAQEMNAGVQAHTSFASIKLDRVKGPLDLTTSHGSIRGDQIDSDKVAAESSFGNIELTCAPLDTQARNTPGSIDVKTSHGSITCHNVTAGQIHARTSFGNIHMDCSASAPSDLQLDAGTSHGSITCQIPSGFTGQVELDTSFGQVQTERSILVQGKLAQDHLRGTIGDGKGNLRLKTQFGGIALR